MMNIHDTTPPFASVDGRPSGRSELSAVFALGLCPQCLVQVCTNSHLLSTRGVAKYIYRKLDIVPWQWNGKKGSFL